MNRTRWIAWKVLSVIVAVSMMVPAALLTLPVKTAQAAVTGYLNPSANASDTGGDGNGFETSPTNAYTNGSGVATNNNGADDRHRYYDYNISVPAGAAISGIEVRIDGRVIDSTSGTSDYDVELSWNAGTSWTVAKTTSELTQSEATYTLGSPSDNWGHAWTTTELNNTNFRVRITSSCTGGSGSNPCSARDFELDWIAVQVTYNRTPNTPTNITPASGATVTTTRNPTFTWSAFSDPDGDTQSQFQVQVRQNPGSYAFRDSNAVNGTGSTYTPTTFDLPDGAYCWHVQVRDNSGASNSWSGYSAETCFTIDANQPPPAPTLVDPANGDTVGDDTPTLDWNPVTDPDPGDSVSSYAVSIDGGAFVDVGTNTDYTPGTPLSNGTHSWQVRACDTHAACSLSAIWSFTVNTNIVNPNQDSYTDQASPSTNFGTNTQMYVRSDASLFGTDANRRMYLRFNLPAITTCYVGTNPSIVQATLRVYADSAPSEIRSYDLYRTTNAWIESGAGSITWNAPPGTTGSATDSTNVNVVGWISWDVTADVQTFSDYGGANTNYGWMIRDNAESQDLFSSFETRFRAREYTGTTYDPQLIITYNCPPSNPALVSPANGAYVASSTPLLDWNAATDPDGDTLHYSVSIDGGAWQSPVPDTLTDFTPLSLLAEGTHNWQVRAFDGRVYSYSASWSFIVDTDTPGTPAYLYEGSPDQDYYPSTAYTLLINWGSVTDTGSGITYELYRRVNGAGWGSPITTTAGTSFTDSGTFVDNDLLEYQVRARTGAGTFGLYALSDGVRIDATDPAQVTGVGEGIVVGTDDDTSNNNVYFVYWNVVADTGSGIIYEVQRSVNGGAYATFGVSGLTCDLTRCWSDDPAGHSSGDFVRYQVRAVNGAGRTGAYSTPSDGILIDSAAPDSSVTTGGVFTPITWPNQIVGTASDGVSGVARVHIQIRDTNTGDYWSGSAWGATATWITATGTTGWSYTFPALNLTDGHTYVVDSRATDVAGNVETSFGNNNFTYSSSAPDAPVPSSTTHPNPLVWYNDNQPSFIWNVPSSSVAVVGYSIVLDQFPGTIPDTIQDTTATSYDAATTPDGTWYFHVRAVNIAGTWGPAGHVRVNIDTTTPQAPSSVTEENPDVDFDADGSVTVFWSAVPNTGSGITYRLERELNSSGVWTLVISTTATSFADSGAYADNTFIRYRVRGTNGVSLSSAWTNSDGMTIDSQTPAQPAWAYEDATSEPDRDYHNAANGAVTVHWAAVADTGSGMTYQLEKRIGAGAWTLVAQNIAGASYADSGSYSDGNLITYRVTPINGVGTAGASRESDGFTIDLDIPALSAWVREGVATDPDWDFDDDGSFTVFWSAVANTGSGITYRLEKSVDDGSWILVAENLSGTSYADSDTYTDGATIRYRVTPINGAGTAGPFKLSDGITIDLDTPAAPSYVREQDPDVDFDTDGAVVVYWAAVANTGSGITYDLQKSINGGAFSTIASNLLVTSYNDTATFADETFLRYQVVARNSVGRSSSATQSDGVRVDTGTPAAPAGVGEGDVVGIDDDFDEDNTFFAYWNAVAPTATGDQIYYTIERNVNGGGWETAATGITATSWEDPRVYSNGDSAAYRITAVNGSGTAGAMSAASDGILVDTGRPNSVVTTAGFYSAVSWPDQIAGTATDDYSDVAAVHITVYDTNANLWWNGSAWAAGGPFWLLTGGTTNWTYALSDANLTNGHAYDVQSRATDRAGNVETTFGTSTFIFAASGPEAPVVSSGTHPVQANWYNHNDPAFTWTIPSGPAPVVGYSYVIDHNPGTTPDTTVDTTGTSAAYNDQADGTWTFHVRALDSAANWGPAGHYQVNIDTATPIAPASVTEESPDIDWDFDGSVTVFWTAVPDTGSGIVYIVERQIGAGSWTVLSSTVAGTQYLDPGTGYADGTFIHYRVSARNGVSLTGPTTTSDGITVDNEVPGTPAWVTENAPDPNDQDFDPDGSVTVYWAASNDTGSGLTYRLERRVTVSGVPGPWTQIASGLTVTSYLDPVIHPDGQFVEYRVTAINGVNSANPERRSDSITIDTGTPAAPAEVTENSPDIDWSFTGSVTVFWSGVADTGSGIVYRLEKQINNGAWELVADNLPGGTTSYANSGAYNDGDFIRYRVHATNGAATVGAWRESDGMTIDSSTPAATAYVREENPDIDFDSDGALTVYWAAITDTGSGITYRLEKELNNSGTWTLLASNLVGTSYFDGTTQPDGTVVHYRVTAVNGVSTAGPTTTSDGVTVDTQLPAAPTGVGEGDVAGVDDVFDQDNTYFVFWNAVADTGSGIVYDIEKSLNGGNWVSAAFDVAGTSWEDPTPYSNGDTLQYRARAVTGAGLQGAWSAASSGITLDFVRPDSAVSTTGFYNAFNWPGFIFGTSSDTGSDVQVVHITLHRASDGLYWNGSTWQVSEVWLTTVGTINWQYAFTPTDGETYDVRSRATDFAGNVELTYGTGSFTFSSSGPQAPVISSPTHPNEATWYIATSATFTWTVPSSAAPVVGYSYVLDQNAGTTPDAVADTTGTTASYPSLADGTWTFHVRALDNAGNWGPADHFAVHIDTATPAAPGSITEESPDIDFDADGAFTVYWSSVADTGSGITYRLERELNTSGTWTLVISTTATSFADSGAYADNTFIRYRVRATNGTNHSSAFVTSDGVRIDSQTPAAPGYVREGVGTLPDWDFDADGSYTVFWGAVADTGSGISYQLSRRINGGSWTPVTTTPAVSYADSGAYADNTLIEYQVTAINGAGLASPAATSDGITIDNETPATPASITEESPDIDWDVDGVFTVFWSSVPNTGSGITYRLERNLNSAGWTVITTTVSTSYVQNIGAVDGANAVYRVTAVNGVGAESGLRTSDGVTVDSQAVAQSLWVREDSATDPDRDYHPNADGAISVYWAGVTETGSGVTYRLEKRVNGGAWTLVASNLLGTSYPDSGAYADNAFIEYQVTASNGVNTQSAARLSDGMRIDLDTPATPTGVGEGDVAGTDDDFDQDNTFWVFWNGVASTATGDTILYTIERSRNGSAWEQAGTAIACSTTPCQWEDPVPFSSGDTVQYRVSAYNGAGRSSAVSIVSDGITLDFVQPESAVTTSGFFNAFNWPGFVHGTASDSLSDVAFVDIQIQRRSDNFYWNGTTWVAGLTWLRATGTLNWQYTLALASLTDGVTYDVRSRATDNAGNVESTLGTNSFTFSGSGPSAPVISSSTHPVQTNWYNNNDPAFSWTVPSSAVPVVGYSFALDQNATTTPDAVADTAGLTASYLNIADGTWYFHVRAVDNASNWGPAAHFTIHIDTATPAAPAAITEESPDVDWDSDGSVTVYWSAVTNTGSGITYRLEQSLNGGAFTLVTGAGALTTTSFTVGGFANGNNVVFRVRAANGVGLTSGWTQSDGVTFDLTTPPAPTGVGEGDVVGTDDDWDQDNTYFVFWNAVAGTPSGITYTVERSRNGGLWEVMVTGLAATQWEDPTAYSTGEHVAYRVTAVTGAGRSSTPSTPSDGLTLDFTRPDSAISTSGFYNSFTWPGSIQGTASDDLSDVAFVDITLQRTSDNFYWNGAAWAAGLTWLRAAGTANWTYTFAPADGLTYNLQSRATDNAANVETTFGTSSFNYSASGPGAPVISSSTHPVQTTWYNNNDPTLNWTTPSSGSGIQGYSYIIDHAPDTEPDLIADTTGNTRTYTNQADGLWYFHVRAVDNANNWGASAHYAVRIDTAAPAATASVTEGSPDVDLDADGNVSVFWSDVIDTSGALYTLQRSTNGGGVWTTVTSGITTTSFLDPVTHPDATALLYRVQVVDAVGFTSAWTQSDGVTIDSSVPAAPANVREGDVVGTDDDFDQDNTFFVFWNAVADTGSGITYQIERSVNGGAWTVAQTGFAQTFWDDTQVFVDGDLVQYRVTATNGLDTVGPVSAVSDGIRLDFTLPDSIVTTSGTYGPASWPGSIQGTASGATSGVSLAQITLQRTSDGLYWNGATWGVVSTWLLASGSTAWSYPFAPVNGESYNVQSRATDNAGNLEVSYGVNSFTYSSSEPDSSVMSGGLYVGAGWTGSITGTAVAPLAAVSFVDITLQRTSDNLYWNGSAWAGAATWLRATGTAGWSYAFTPADGTTYSVRSRATDAVNNVETVYGANTFSYDAAAPNITSVGVTSSSSWFYNPGLSATGGTLYFNSRTGEGAGQTLTVVITYTEPNPASLTPPTAFGDSPPIDTAAPWTAAYSVEAFAGTQSAALFTVADTLGLTDTAAIDFTLDNTPPDSAASLVATASNVSPLNVEWSASDGASGVREVHLWVKYQPIGAWADTGLVAGGLSGSFTYTPTLGTGTYYFATVGVDRVGNTETAPSGFGDDSIDFDNVAPSSTMSAQAYAITSPIPITWTASFDAKYTYLYYRYGDSGPFSLAPVPFSTALAGTFEFTPADGDGHYYFATVSIDDAGNSEAIGANGKAMVIYDTTAPASSATSPTEATGLSVSVDWSGDDTPVGTGIAHYDLEVKINDGAWTPWLTDTIQTSGVFTPTYTGDPDVTLHFRVRAQDNAGHVEAWPAAADGDTTTLLHFPGAFPGKYKVYLPIIARNTGGPLLPDLVVTNVSVTPSNIVAGLTQWDVSITVKNQGTAPLPNGVWMDLYIDPNPARLPIEANETFDEICPGPYGGLWWIPQLNPGESVTLSKDDILTDWLPYFPTVFGTPGVHTLYVQIDSLDERTATPPSWARVYESNESNNVYDPDPSTTAIEPVVVNVAGFGGSSAQSATLPSVPNRVPPK